MNAETEEEIEIPDPTRVERIISWIKIAFATKKAIMIVWAIFFGVSGTAIVGQVTETTPLMDIAEAFGIVQERGTQEVSGDVPDVVFDELLNIQEDIRVGMETITENQRLIREHTHEALSVPHSHDLLEHTHPPIEIPDQSGVYAELNHTHDMTHTHDLEQHSHAGGQVVAGKAEIDDALLRHIADDH